MGCRTEDFPHMYRVFVLSMSSFRLMMTFPLGFHGGHAVRTELTGMSGTAERTQLKKGRSRNPGPKCPQMVICIEHQTYTGFVPSRKQGRLLSSSFYHGHKTVERSSATCAPYGGNDYRLQIGAIGPHGE